MNHKLFLRMLLLGIMLCNAPLVWAAAPGIGDEPSSMSEQKLLVLGAQAVERAANPAFHAYMRANSDVEQQNQWCLLWRHSVLKYNADQVRYSPEHVFNFFSMAAFFPDINNYVDVVAWGDFLQNANRAMLTGDPKFPPEKLLAVAQTDIRFSQMEEWPTASVGSYLEGRISVLVCSSAIIAYRAKNEQQRQEAFTICTDTRDTIARYIEQFPSWCRIAAEDQSQIEYSKLVGLIWLAKANVHVYSLCDNGNFDPRVGFDSAGKAISALKQVFQKKGKGKGKEVSPRSLPELQLILLEAYCHKANLCLASLGQTKATAECFVECIAESNKVLKILKSFGKSNEQFLEGKAYIANCEQQLRQIEQHLVLKKRGQSAPVEPRTRHQEILELEAGIVAMYGLDPNDLSGIYAKHKQMRRGLVYSDLADFIACFLAVGEFAQAEARAAILCNFTQHNSQENPKMHASACELLAHTQNFQGNFEPLLAIQQQRYLKEKAAKERQRQNMIGLIQQARAQQDEADQAQALQKSQTRQRKAQRNQARVVKVPSRAMGDRQAYAEHGSMIAEAEAKHAMERDQRHAVAKEARAVAAGSSQAPKPAVRALFDSGPVSGSSQASREALLNSFAEDKKPLVELYQLKGVPATVAVQIQTGDWQFTRGNMMLFLEAVGCDNVRTRGSHITIPLPRTTCIVLDGEVIMALSEFTERQAWHSDEVVMQTFGGSLVLTSWDQAFVPYFMRSQISTAYERLRVLKLMQLKDPRKLSA
ncbi:MAG: hypothetical protein WCG04_05095 [Alphaproteobacteria bacterium]